jgi:hypothetical protein
MLKGGIILLRVPNNLNKYTNHRSKIIIENYLEVWDDEEPNIDKWICKNIEIVFEGFGNF